MEGIAGRPYHIKRMATCLRLLQLLEDYKVLVIKAPPQSGKTSMLQLLYTLFSYRGMPTKDIFCIRSGEAATFDFESTFQQKYNTTFAELVEGKLP